MRDQRFSPTTVVGAISAAATTGALIAIGHRTGNASAPFLAIGSVVRRSASARGIGGLILSGIVVQVAGIFVWSAICVRLAERLRVRVFAAVAVAIVNFLVSGFVARWTGAGMASELTLGDRVIYAIVLTASLIVGMRYAFLHPRETATS